MAIVTFFRRPKPRGFNYKPIHYDPVQEAREQRRKELLGDDAVSPYDKEGAKAYAPGKFIRDGGIRRSRPGASEDMAAKRRRNQIRMVAALVVLILLAVWMFV